MLMNSSLFDMVADPNDVMSPNSPLRLCGTVGQELMTNVKQEKYTNPVEMCRAYFRFFSVPDAIVRIVALHGTHRVVGPAGHDH